MTDVSDTVASSHQKRSSEAALRDRRQIVIAPASGWVPLDLREFWSYRGLLFFLALRDIKVRYKQTVLGAAWAVLQPVLTMVVFSIFFGKLAGIPSDGVPYPLFAFCGLIPWHLFSFSLTQAGNSLVAEQRLITKVYFPRIIIPLASVLTGVLDSLISLVVFMGLLVYFQVPITAKILLLPVLMFGAVLAALSVGIWLAALNVKYRDFRYTIPFLVQLWMFASPVAYPSSLVPEAWRSLYGLNPMAGIVEGFRWALIGTPPPGGLIAVSIVTVLVLLTGGLFYFRRMEDHFADII